MDWTQVITDPLGIAGFALALVFSVISRTLRKKRTGGAPGIVWAGYAVAVICVVGGFGLAFQRYLDAHRVAAPASAASGSQQPAAATHSSMHINRIEQNVENGPAVAGIQGDVSIHSSERESAMPPRP